MYMRLINSFKLIIIIFICHDIQYKPDTESIINNEISMAKGLDTIWYMCPHTNNLIIHNYNKCAKCACKTGVKLFQIKYAYKIKNNK